jgi:hypothetical protein
MGAWWLAVSWPRWILVAVLMLASVHGPLAMTAQAQDIRVVVCGQLNGRDAYAEFASVNSGCLKFVRRLVRDRQNRDQDRATSPITVRMFIDRDPQPVAPMRQVLSLLADEQVDAIELYTRIPSGELHEAHLQAAGGAWNLALRGTDDVERAWRRSGRFTLNDLQVVDMQQLSVTLGRYPPLAPPPGAVGQWWLADVPVQELYPFPPLQADGPPATGHWGVVVLMHVLAYWGADVGVPLLAWHPIRYGQRREIEYRRSAMDVALAVLGAAMGFGDYRLLPWYGVPVAPAEAATAAVAAAVPPGGTPAVPAAPALAPGVPAGAPSGVHASALALVDQLARGPQPRRAPEDSSR